MATNKTNQSLTDLATERIALKAQIEELSQRLSSLDEALIFRLQRENITKVETSVGKINLVQNNTVVWNEEVLKGILTTAQWKRVIVEKIDKTRLEAEITIGRIESSDVDVAKSIKQSKPFIR